MFWALLSAARLRRQREIHTGFIEHGTTWAITES
jgi:hypothetical protein